MKPAFLIAREGLEFRLAEIRVPPAPRDRYAEGRDVLRGGRVRLRMADVIAVHADEAAAIASLNAAKAEAARLDAGIAAARRAYVRACRERDQKLAAAARGEALTAG